MALFGSVSAVWALLVMALFLLAIQLSYKVERRSDPEKFARGPLRYANPFGVMLNIGVARDAETQAMRRRIIIYALAILALFAGFAIFVFLAGPTTPSDPFPELPDTI